jgi:hypothetical protein
MSYWWVNLFVIASKELLLFVSSIVVVLVCFCLVVGEWHIWSVILGLQKLLYKKKVNHFVVEISCFISIFSYLQTSNTKWKCLCFLTFFSNF